ncbi:hypothetical protein BGZ73_005245 [Actinomortierella ambigua]|nr:hypothetical protein BGZ73_005245 [Actinomortierella ambigua]
MPTAFDSHEYWQKRFEHEDTFEWLMSWNALESHLDRLGILVPEGAGRSTQRVLNLGCGNSTLPLDLYHAGYRHVLSVDFVKEVVDRMREKCQIAIGWKEEEVEAEKGMNEEVKGDTKVTANGGGVDQDALQPQKGQQKQNEDALIRLQQLHQVTTAAAAATTTAIITTTDMQSKKGRHALDRRQECPLEFREMDCLDLTSLAPNTFDLIFDKSTSDAIACGDDNESTKIKTLCRQVARVTKPGGVWCVVSYSQYRQYEFEDEDQGLWTTERVEPIKVEAPRRVGEEKIKDKSKASQVVVHQPDIFQYLYVNRRRIPATEAIKT